MGLLACLLAAGALAVPVQAAQKGTIRVTMDYGFTGPQAAVELQCVGEPAQGDYRLGEAFGGGIVRREDVHGPELAQWLAQRSGEGERLLLDADGNADFTDLDQGLYLLTQVEAPEGWSCADPVLVPMPLDGQWQVQARPKTAELLTESPRTGQHPAPLLGAMGLVLSGTGLYFCLEKLRKK